MKFNPLSALWICDAMGSMNKVTRNVLKLIVRERIFTDEALPTSLTKVGSMINRRPYTAARDDISDLEPIMPNHLLVDMALVLEINGKLLKQSLTCFEKSG